MERAMEQVNGREAPTRSCALAIEVFCVAIL